MQDRLVEEVQQKETKRESYRVEASESWRIKHYRTGGALTKKPASDSMTERRRQHASRKSKVTFMTIIRRACDHWRDGL